MAKSPPAIVGDRTSMLLSPEVEKVILKKFFNLLQLFTNDTKIT